MVLRSEYENTLRDLIRDHRVVGIIGARQVGKTTLARKFMERVQQPVTYFDLENPEDLARIIDPMIALKQLKGIIVIDEVQRLPGLFEVIRVLVDRPRMPAKFIILGSTSPDLLRQGSETLAGRIYYYEIGGFSVAEVGMSNYAKLWLRGGFPRSYLARTNVASHQWRLGFVRTFLERDLPQLGVRISATTLRRFLTMLAHNHGRVWNASEYGRSFGVADTTVRNYLDLLTSALIVRQLQPWHENIKKRQVKAPKVFFADTGLLHSLLNCRSLAELEAHPKLGASWEGFVIEQIIRNVKAAPEECFFWGTHSGAELDLLIVRGHQRLGFEIKRTSAPAVTKSMNSALVDLKLHSLDVIHAGEHTFPLADNIRAVSFSRLLEDVKPLA